MSQMTTKHSHNTKSSVCTSFVGQSGPFKYASLVIEVPLIDCVRSRGSYSLLYGDSIALIGACRSKKCLKVLSSDTEHEIAGPNLNGRAILTPS